MIKYIATLSVILMTTSCATQGKYREITQSYLGHDEATLVRSLGAPSETYETGTSKFLSYSKRSSRTDLTLTCKTTYEVSGSKVVHVSFQGNNCIAM